LERSNVDLAEEMVALLSAQRNFQANARAIDTATQISQTVLNLRQ
ncbi:MAG: flagellar biosynthesis protein FlgE, partial [Alphaproteobacteria bacterium HGW-Alphaproteobacteria-16]